jgi:PqqD family protein of HPr-rel-A system
LAGRQGQAWHPDVGHRHEFARRFCTSGRRRLTAPAVEPSAYRAAPPGDLSWFASGDEHVVYHHPSGKTHLLNAGSALLIQAVLRDPRTSEQAADELARLQDALSDPRFREHVSGLLARFAELGLVERLAP